MGIVYSFYNQIFPPKPTWGVYDIPDLSGRVMIVTGGYSGVGKETVKVRLYVLALRCVILAEKLTGRCSQAILAKNAQVYIAGRSQDKAAKAIEELKAETGKKALFLMLDLADLRAVKASVEEFLRYKTLILTWI